MIDSISDFFRGRDYSGFFFIEAIRHYEYDSYNFKFLNKEDNKYFQMSITHQAIVNMTKVQIIDYIDKSLRNHPDLKKASHHQEFYNKFDGIIND